MRAVGKPHWEGCTDNGEPEELRCLPAVSCPGRARSSLMARSAPALLFALPACRDKAQPGLCSPCSGQCEVLRWPKVSPLLCQRHQGWAGLGKGTFWGWFAAHSAFSLCTQIRTWGGFYGAKKNFARWDWCSGYFQGGQQQGFLHKHIPDNTGHPESLPDRLPCLPRQVGRFPDPSEPLLVPSRMP